MHELEELALRAGPAIENARRFREARQLADLDALTGLHNRRYFHETLAREVARAHRYNRQLALIIFDLDDFKAINDRIGHLAGDAVLAEAAERVRESSSAPPTSPAASAATSSRSSSPSRRSRTPTCSTPASRRRVVAADRPGGLADDLGRRRRAPPDDDAIAFFQRGDRALYGAKEAGKGQVVAATMMRPEPPTRVPPTIAPPQPSEESQRNTAS